VTIQDHFCHWKLLSRGILFMHRSTVVSCYRTKPVSQARAHFVFVIIGPLMSQYFMCLPNNSCRLPQTVAFLLRPVHRTLVSVHICCVINDTHIELSCLWQIQSKSRLAFSRKYNASQPMHVYERFRLSSMPLASISILCVSKIGSCYRCILKSWKEGGC
jgi:hypothetical protein